MQMAKGRKKKNFKSVEVGRRHQGEKKPKKELKETGGETHFRVLAFSK